MKRLILWVQYGNAVETRYIDGDYAEWTFLHLYGLGFVYARQAISRGESEPLLQVNLAHVIEAELVEIPE